MKKFDEKTILEINMWRRLVKPKTKCERFRILLKKAVIEGYQKLSSDEQNFMSGHDNICEKCLNYGFGLGDGLELRKKVKEKEC